MTDRLTTGYARSRALVVGISDYAQVSPSLTNAAPDAEHLSALLRDEFGFTVDLLTNQSATRAAIIDGFAAIGSRCGVNDRLLLFFAGHGTASIGGTRGFLLPYDAQPGRQSSLIRMDDFMLGLDSISAKHVLLLFDACFSGLALRRSAGPLIPRKAGPLDEGMIRFLRRSTLDRTVRVLTAGKARQTVADLGGPLPGHSPFTGYLIEALRGAASPDGVLIADDVIQYVKRKVSVDLEANQTPQDGRFGVGEGEFIFSVPGGFDVLKESGEEGTPPPSSERPTRRPRRDILDRIKTLHRSGSPAELHDAVAAETKRVVARIAELETLPPGEPTAGQFLRRIQEVDDTVTGLCRAQAFLHYWAESSPTLSLASGRLSEGSGVLRRYAAQAVFSSGGIAAFAKQRYSHLFELFETGEVEPFPSLIRVIGDGLTTVDRAFGPDSPDASPRSEHLGALLGPIFDDVLSIGTSFGGLFDRFEVFAWLQHAHHVLSTDKLLPLTLSQPAALGRFATSRRQMIAGLWFGMVGVIDINTGKVIKPPTQSNIVNDIVSEAKADGESWAPLTAGLFGRTSARFGQLTRKLATAIDDRLARDISVTVKAASGSSLTLNVRTNTFVRALWKIVATDPAWPDAEERALQQEVAPGYEPGYALVDERVLVDWLKMAESERFATTAAVWTKSGMKVGDNWYLNQLDDLDVYDGIVFRAVARRNPILPGMFDEIVTP